VARQERKLSQAETKAAADWATDQLAALTTKGKGERSKAPACTLNGARRAALLAIWRTTRPLSTNKGRVT
jgi:hypothetical protein